MQSITPCLWFDGNAEEAVDFYVSIFKNSRIRATARFGPAAAAASGQPPGSVMSIVFQLDGQEFVALNGGPQFTFSPAISLMVHCATQQEIDEFWEKLSAGGTKGRCGWLTDRYGVSWQVVPVALGEMMQSPDPLKRERAMRALLQMDKLDLRGLQDAYERG